MISRRVGNHTSTSLRFAKFGQCIETASELESAHALVVFAFQIDLRFHSIV
jgi:hypothetical protein